MSCGRGVGKCKTVSEKGGSTAIDVNLSKLDKLEKTKHYVQNLITTLGDPSEWEFTDNVSDCGQGNTSEKCACGHPIRFLFEIKNKKNPNKINQVGSTCIKYFEGVNPETYERLVDAENKLMERIKEQEKIAKETLMNKEIDTLDSEYQYYREGMRTLAVSLSKSSGNGRIPYWLFTATRQGYNNYFRSTPPTYQRKDALIKWYKKEIDRIKRVYNDDSHDENHRFLMHRFANDAQINSLLPKENQEFLDANERKHYYPYPEATGSIFTNIPTQRMLLNEAIIQRGNLLGDDRQKLIEMGCRPETLLPDCRYLLVKATGKNGIISSDELRDDDEIIAIETKPGVPCSLVVMRDELPDIDFGTIIIGKNEHETPSSREMIWTTHPGLPLRPDAKNDLKDGQKLDVSDYKHRKTYFQVKLRRK